MITIQLGPEGAMRGERVFAAPRPVAGVRGVAVRDADLPLALPVGAQLKDAEGNALFLVTGSAWLPEALPGQVVRMVRGAWLEALADIEPRETGHQLEPVKSGLALAWITLSDKGAAGLREDTSGPTLETLARGALDIAFARGIVLPDDEQTLRARLTDLALEQGYDLILTTGGTGVGPRDITPEATLAVIEMRLEGFERAMTAASLAKTPRGAISRAVVGTLNDTLIINLPGSAKAVAENFEAIAPTIAHTIEKLQGDMSDCGT